MAYCPICNSKSSEKVRMHFYKYMQCNRCKHIWNCADEKSMRYQLMRLRNRQRSVYREVLQNTLTNSHASRKRSENRTKLHLLGRFSKNPSRILELDCQDGSFEQVLNEETSYQGLSLDKFYLPHLSPNARIGDASSIHEDERFDIVLLVDYLEFCYDPYNDIIKCLSRLDKDGQIIISVPLEQNPAKRYLAAAHCFSDKSARILAKSITKNYEVIENFETSIIVLRS